MQRRQRHPRLERRRNSDPTDAWVVHGKEIAGKDAKVRVGMARLIDNELGLQASMAAVPLAVPHEQRQIGVQNGPLAYQLRERQNYLRGVPWWIRLPELSPTYRARPTRSGYDAATGSRNLFPVAGASE